MTEAQTNAVSWLRQHGGDGLWDKNGILIAAGERAPFMRGTWNALRDAGLVEFYSPAGKGRGRCRLTAKAAEVPEVPRHIIDSLQECMLLEGWEEEEATS